MKLLDRWRLMRLKRQLGKVRAEDTLERSQVQTTAHMMRHVVARAKEISRIEMEIREIEGPDERAESSWGPELPTGIGPPTTRLEKRDE